MIPHHRIFFLFPVKLIYANMFFCGDFFLLKNSNLNKNYNLTSHFVFSYSPDRPPSPDAASKPFKQPPLHITPALHPAHVPLAYQCHKVGRQMESPPCQLALGENGLPVNFASPEMLAFIKIRC